MADKEHSSDPKQLMYANNERVRGRDISSLNEDFGIYDRTTHAWSLSNFWIVLYPTKLK